MNFPLISIVIPVYNVEEYIEHCIHDILSQTYRNLEVIIVNDGSLDESISIAKELTKDDSRFIYIDKENGGQSDARNVGLDYASGDYIFFCDPDDFMFEKTIENLYYASAFRFHKGKYAEDQFIMWKLYLASKVIVRYQSDVYAYRVNYKGLTQNYSLSHLDFIEAIEERIQALMKMPELGYPMELAFKQYQFALNRNISMLEESGFVQEAVGLRQKLEYFENTNSLFLEDRGE